MRHLAIAAAVATASLGTTAHAQSIGDLLGLAARGSSTASRLQYNSCSWQKGIAQTLCGTQRLLSVANDADQARRAYEQARRREATAIDMRDRRPDLTVQMASLCEQGDKASCDGLVRWRRAAAAYQAAVDRQHGLAPTRNDPSSMEDGLDLSARRPESDAPTGDRTLDLSYRPTKKAAPITSSLVSLCQKGRKAACDQIRTSAGLLR